MLIPVTEPDGSVSYIEIPDVVFSAPVTIAQETIKAAITEAIANTGSEIGTPVPPAAPYTTDWYAEQPPFVPPLAAVPVAMIADELQGIGSRVDLIEKNLQDYLARWDRRNREAYQLALGGLTDLLAEETTRVDNAIANAVEAAITPILNTLDANERLYNDSVNSILSGVSQTLSRFKQQEIDAENQLRNSLIPPLTEIADSLNTTTASLLGFVGTELADVQERSDALILGAFAHSEVQLASLWAEQNETKKVLASGISEASLRKLFLDSKEFIKERNRFFKLSETDITGFLKAGISTDDFLELLNPFGGLSDAIVTGFASALSIFAMAQAKIRPVLNWTEQQAFSRFPNVPLPLDTLVRLSADPNFNREFITTEALKQGISPDNFDLIQLVEQKRITPTEAGMLLLRGIITSERFSQEMLLQGYQPQQVEYYRALLDYIPPVQDLITFAVREIYNPQLRAELHIDDEFPQAFATEAAKQGISEATAKNYWAAHWRLPSLTDAFEMFHRQLITKEQLDALIKAADFAPFWRPLLTEIAYTPYTRVDIRRMYQHEVLSETEVYKAYRDLGYNDERARRITEFVVKEYTRDKQDVEKRERDLTRADIVGLYEDATIDRQRATEMLVTVGYDANEADLILLRTDNKLLRAERKAAIDLIISKARKGLITYEMSVDQLNRLDLSARESEAALTRIVNERELHQEIPKINDLEDFVKNGAITMEEFANALREIGFAEKWVGVFQFNLAIKLDPTVAEKRMRANILAAKRIGKELSGNGRKA